MSDSTNTQKRIMQRLSAARQSVVALDEIQRELRLDAQETAAALRGLLQNGRVALRRGGGGTGDDTRMFLSLAGNLSEHAELVLSAVRASGTSGIDQAQLISKVRMPKSEVLKILHALIEDRHIQEHRSFSNRAKRMYLLFNLKPSAQVTGGSFYCGEKLDVAYIDELRRRLVAFVAEQRTVTMPQIKSFLDDQHIADASGESGGAASDRLPRSPSTVAAGGHAAETFYDLSSPIRFVDQHAVNQSQLSFPAAPVAGATSTPFGSASSSATPQAPQLPARTLSDRDVQILVHSLMLDGVLEEVMPSVMTELTTSISSSSATMGEPAGLGRRHTSSLLEGGDALTEDVANRDGFLGGAHGRAAPHVLSLTASGDMRTPRHYQLAPAGANVVRHFAATRKRSREGSWQRRSTSSATDGGQATLLRLGHRTADVEADRRDQAQQQRTLTQSRHARLMNLLQEEGLFVPSSLSEQTVAASSGGGYMPAVGFPCLGCPQLAQCSPTATGLLNVQRCVYMKAWLGE